MCSLRYPVQNRIRTEVQALFRDFLNSGLVSFQNLCGYIYICYYTKNTAVTSKMLFNSQCAEVICKDISEIPIALSIVN